MDCTVNLVWTPLTLSEAVVDTAELHTLLWVSTHAQKRSKQNLRSASSAFCLTQSFTSSHSSIGIWCREGVDKMMRKVANTCMHTVPRVPRLRNLTYLTFSFRRNCKKYLCHCVPTCTCIGNSLCSSTDQLSIYTWQRSSLLLDHHMALLQELRMVHKPFLSILRWHNWVTPNHILHNNSSLWDYLNNTSLQMVSLLLFILVCFSELNTTLWTAYNCIDEVHWLVGL